MQSEVNIYKGSHTIFLLLFTDSSKGNTFRVTAARLYNSSVQNLKYTSLSGWTQPQLAWHPCAGHNPSNHTCSILHISK